VKMFFRGGGGENVTPGPAVALDGPASCLLHRVNTLIEPPIGRGPPRIE